MSSKLDYLQKYLSQGDTLPTADNEEKVKKKKKKKSKEVKSSHVMQIFDPDDAGKYGRDKGPDGKGQRQKEVEVEDEGVDDERFLTMEEQPQVAGFIDERPDTEIMKERFTTSTFQPVSRNRNKEDLSPPRSSRQSMSIKEERDISPPRRRGDDEKRAHGSRREESPTRRRPYIKEEPDVSPPRRHDGGRRRSPSPPGRRSSAREERDHSPPRRKPKEERDISPPRRNERKRESSNRASDISPPRKRASSRERDLSPPRHLASVKVERDLSPPRKLFDGKRAGLQDAKALKEELVSLKQREKEMFAQLSSEVSGRGAETKVRGRLKEREEEAQRKKEENEITAEVKQQYSRWNKGVKQTQEISERIATDLHEMDKPLARRADDADLDQHLKSIERAEDPMLEFLRKKRAKTSGAKKYPTYVGPPPPVNRFGILPGYRWDGVDRSSGFEKKLFERQNNRKALSEEAYKWSTEDM